MRRPYLACLLALAGTALGVAIAGSPLLRLAHADETAPAAKPPASTAPTWAEARKLAHEGNLPRAIVAARAILAADPRHAAAARLLQDLLRAAGKTEPVTNDRMPALLRRALGARVHVNPERRVRYLTAVLKEDGAQDLFRLDLAHALLAIGKDSQAESEAQRYLKAHPDAPEGLTSLGRILLARGKTKDASAALERALSAEAGLPGAAVVLARLHAVKEQPAESRSVLQAALAVYPKNPGLLAEFAEDQIRAAEYDLALRTLTTLLDLPIEKSAVHVRMAEVHRIREALPEAGRCAQAALAINPKSARALRVVGFLQQKKGELEAALATYERAAKLAPTSAVLHADVGFIHMLMGKTLLAERALRRALELDEDLLDARRTLGIVLFQRGKPKLAKKELSAVLKKDDDDLRANRYMGYILLDEGKSKAAAKLFDKVAELDPKDYDSLRMMGNAYLRMGKVEQAIESYQEAIGRNGKYGFAYFDLGRALEKQERFEDAAAAYRKSAELDKTLPHPHLYLAELLDEVLDEPEEALKHYKQYLDLDGHGEGGWIKKRVEQLERDVEEEKNKKK